MAPSREAVAHYLYQRFGVTRTFAAPPRGAAGAYTYASN